MYVIYLFNKVVKTTFLRSKEELWAADREERRTWEARRSCSFSHRSVLSEPSETTKDQQGSESLSIGQRSG